MQLIKKERMSDALQAPTLLFSMAYSNGLVSAAVGDIFLLICGVLSPLNTARVSSLIPLHRQPGHPSRCSIGRQCAANA